MELDAKSCLTWTIVVLTPTKLRVCYFFGNKEAANQHAQGIMEALDSEMNPDWWVFPSFISTAIDHFAAPGALII